MNLFVAGLPFDVTDAGLEQIFEEFGTVKSAKVILDRETRKSRGFGFVEMEDSEAAEAAIKSLDGSKVGGRNIAVKVAEERAGGSGGGGGYRSGGGGGYKSGGGSGGYRGGGGRDRY